MAVTIPNTFTNGYPAIASEVNGNFAAVKAFVDGIQTGTNIDTGAIVDSKLAVISTAGKVANSATTATSNNVADKIVTRDPSGNFSAGTITAALTGTASGNLVSGGALGTPSSGTLTNCTFPTLNQNTTGSAGSVPYSGLTGAVPTWNQNTTGNAATADSATSAGTSTYATVAIQGAGDAAINPSGQTGSWSGGTYTMAFTFNYAKFWGTAFLPQSTGAVLLGNAAFKWSAVWATTGTIQTSDARLKKDITPTDLGLQFINKLNPVSYRWILGGYEPIDESDPEQVAQKRGLPRTGVRKHYGLIAQELKATLDELNVEDFAGYVQDDLTDPNSSLSVSYNNLFAPIIKAVQELSQQIETLTTRINALEQ